MADEQRNLWQPTDSEQSVAEKCLVHFAERYRCGCRRHPTGSPWPQKYDDASYACVLIAAEHGAWVTQTGREVLRACAESTPRDGAFAGAEVLPWEVALELLDTEGESSPSLHKLAESLSHGKSTVRPFLLQTGWLCRWRLPRAIAVRALLHNVAFGHFYSDWSVAFCASLFATEEDFWSFAQAFQPHLDFPTHNQDNLTRLRAEQCLSRGRDHFAELELRIRRMVEVHGLRLRHARS